MKLKPIAVEVYSNKGQRVSHRRTGRLVCNHPAMFSSVRELEVP